MRRISVWSVLLASAIAMSTAIAAYADSQWTAATTTFPGSIRAGSREIPVKPGDKTVIAIKSLQAGTTVTILNGAEVLTPKPLTADEKGNLTIPLTVPADAATGLHPLTVITQNPASVSQVVSANAMQHAHPRLFPHITGMSDIAFLAGILLLFAGVEVHAVHAPELKEPQKQFPKAMFLAALISFGLFTLGSLAVAVITPYDQINLQSGLFTTFDIVFKHYRVGWLTNVMSLLIAFGVLAGVMSWISGPSRGLLWTAKEGQLPEFMKKTNKNGVQVNILVIQGCIVSVLSSLYIVMKDVSVAFFLLSALTIGLYLIMYMMMYAAGIRLRYTQPDLPRSYRVPGGNAGMWCIGGGGFLAVLFAFTVTFFPPSQLPVGSPALYTGLVVAGTVVFLAIPIVISVAMGRRARKNRQPSK